ncbi:LytR/AlgR family response regulator transcription factor [Aquimarina sp. 2201CG14-23]|uniref:LytR/AlgR family response regulator transcription factor n=1 Tax=Aquimarina mycalae TaxID=3040073 RepID=UPI0024780843|nr:LytTR family DNA-binding domain-containing protein [Aquimarina sp. 2201CG14-23]MDH7447133.1 LytTR family DNA-binding domain-containing protein [Aquimarina sp. 2201CG14-23]
MISSVIIDDEPNAIELLKGYIEKLPFIACVHSFRNPIEALVYLKENTVDLIFLDINMPQLSGISFLKTLEKPPKIILTTAYAEYAVESYEYQVADYLLKPISFERFLKALLKIQQVIEQPEGLKKINTTVYVKSGQQQYKTDLKDILYLQKDGNYITYYTSNRTILARQSIKDALLELGDRFIQVHKSTIINLDHITAFDTNSITIQQTKLSVGQSYKLLLMERLALK